jgi:xanthine/CO dehydrogenase XdhC/CoxF family maturation factor
MPRFYEQLVAALAEKQPFTLALISGVKGSSPQRIGAKALFFQDGRIAGTVGGGCLEAEVHSRAQKALKSGQAATFEMLLDHDFGWDDGLICGGSVRGLILPDAAQSADIWRVLARTETPLRWGVKKDFPSRWPTTMQWENGFIRKPFRRHMHFGLPAPVTSRRRLRRWPCNLISR